ncbi:MAG: ion transporter [Chlorobi bacterium]|nr:ion transporter [Chlorobiota bacterium]
MDFRTRTWHILSGTPTPTQRIGKAIDLALLALIFLNVAAGILETVSSIHERWGWILWWFDAFSVAVFSGEYVLRVWACTADRRYRHWLWGRLRFMGTPLAIVDLLAIAPFYLPLLFPHLDLRFLRILRLTFRLLRIIRYSHTLSIFITVAKTERREIAASISVLLILVVLASSLMYYIEHPHQPDKFPDIPSAMWWAIITLTTVGYGDVYPLSPVGKILGGVVALMGIGLVALPTAILSSGFIRELQRRYRRHTHRCPHCGAVLEE